jgi:hypothetical protein
LPQSARGAAVAPAGGGSEGFELTDAAKGADATGGVTTRLDNGDFLRIIRDLRRVHSHIAALTYPVLEPAGFRTRSAAARDKEA